MAARGFRFPAQFQQVSPADAAAMLLETALEPARFQLRAAARGAEPGAGGATRQRDIPRLAGKRRR